MGLDLGLLWRAGVTGAVVRAALNLAERSFISYTVDKVISLPLGGLVALLTGAYFVYNHAEQDVPPSLVGGALAGTLATVMGLFLAYRFSFRWLGPIGDGPVVLVVALIAGAVGGLVMRRFRRV
jgi:hypothetical protein